VLSPDSTPRRQSHYFIHAPRIRVDESDIRVVRLVKKSAYLLSRVTRDSVSDAFNFSGSLRAFTVPSVADYFIFSDSLRRPIPEHYAGVIRGRCVVRTIATRSKRRVLVRLHARLCVSSSRGISA